MNYYKFSDFAHESQNKFKSTSNHWGFFSLEPILKYIHIRLCISLALVNLSFTLVNLFLIWV
jgi:hypothetical protein